MASPIWDENGKFWRYRVTKDYQTKNFKSSKPGLAGKREVLKKARDYENGVKNASHARTASAWSDFLEETATRLGANSEAYKQYEKLGRLYILPALGSKKLAAVTKQDWQRVINEATPHDGRREVLSKKYLTSIRMTINVFVKFTNERGMTEPFYGALYIPAGRPVYEKDTLQPEQLRELFRPSDLHYHKAFLFMAVTGCRPGEVCGLMWSDVKKDVIEIHRAINASNVITEGKNKNAKRLIPLSPILNEILTQQRNNTRHLKSPYIFCDRVGGHGIQSTMRNDYIKLKAERGLSGSMYSLRHTFISLVKNSMPEQMIKQLVGHSVNMDTFGVYGHMINGEMQQAASIVNLTVQEAIKEEQ